MTIEQYTEAPQPDAIVYVRSVAVTELPAELRPQVEGINTIYAVHSADGERLALVRDREMAFVLARQNELAPVSVH
ncbi:DUF1150 family protein [Maritimibacter sp. DP1N21-5]|uniref:DUF1150 family protein n=1 Tax=Maritimibacter sp. DP1N21-5 TaxID=2836867 RepID=UPI001C48685D|nr:DUF1150 family protein [Maritimibacter sp. DP1N21-5]MBV7409168.1 DUF1150 domain-containing protein [Maritimibacter sp. DP1N21-5]